MMSMFIGHDASVVHASGAGQLQANPNEAGPWLSHRKPTRRTVATMGSNDLVVEEDHMLGQRCQRYNWQTGMCGSIAFGSSPRIWKTMISNPRCLAKYPLVEKTSGDNLEEKSGVEPLKAVMLNCGLSPAAPQGGGYPHTQSRCGVHAQVGPDKLGLRQDTVTHEFFLFMLCFFLSYFVHKALRRLRYG